MDGHCHRKDAFALLRNGRASVSSMSVDSQLIAGAEALVFCSFTGWAGGRVDRRRDVPH
jgi:hypothetical protein